TMPFFWRDKPLKNNPNNILRHMSEIARVKVPNKVDQFVRGARWPLYSIRYVFSENSVIVDFRRARECRSQCGQDLRRIDIVKDQIREVARGTSQALIEQYLAEQSVNDLSCYGLRKLIIAWVTRYSLPNSPRSNLFTKLQITIEPQM